MGNGYAALHPLRTPKQYHFANKQHRLMAGFGLIRLSPTTLLYKKTGDGYELEGAMGTVPRGRSEDQLHERVLVNLELWG